MTTTPKPDTVTATTDRTTSPELRVVPSDTAKPSPPAAGAKSIATELVEMAQASYRFGTSTTGETFGIPLEGAPVTFMLRGGKHSLRARLADRYFASHGKAASSTALTDALLTIEGIGQEWETELHLRVAGDGLDRSTWIDLGDNTGRAIHLTEHGWTIEAKAPVLFRRTALTAPLPTPTTAGAGGVEGLKLLWQILNVEEDDRPLVAAWLVAALVPDIPHPTLALFGEQGTGKTTATKLLVSIVDPSPVPARKPPRDADGWVTAAAGSWVVAIDNLSTIPLWLSDSLCRAVTGDGDVRRRLYSDSDLHVFSFRRVIVFNGIDVGSLNGDLADRMLPINLERIPDTNRLDETHLWPAWNDIHPQVLGAVLDLAANVFTQLPLVELTQRPRMADFARILAATDNTLHTDGLDRYLVKQGSLAAESLDTDPLIAAITTRIHNQWTGTASQLLVQLTNLDEPTPKDWPTTPRTVTGRLKRWAPVLRKTGWTVTDDAGRNKDGTVKWTLNPPPNQI